MMKGAGHRYKRIVVAIFSMMVLLLACLVMTACDGFTSSKEYTITYYTDGDSLGAGNANEVSETVSNESDYYLPPLTKVGYKFCGWYSNVLLAGEPVEYIPEGNTKNYKLYAKFSPLHYVEYDLQGGINSTDNPLNFCEAEQIVLSNPTKQGYAFLGWYKNGQKVSVIQMGTTEDIWLEARWELGVYKLTWDLRGGSSTASYPSQYTYGIGISSDSFVIPTQNDMVFAGWYVNMNGGEKYIKSISDTDEGNMDIYAKWVKAEQVNVVPSWNKDKSVSAATSDELNSSAMTVTVPEELLDIYNDGRLAVEITATLFSNVRSQGNCTATASSYIIINGTEHQVSSVSATGGGYPILFSQFPADGSWGYSGYQTRSYSLNLTSSSIQIGYRYMMTSDRSNDSVKISMNYGCTRIICKFYIV